MVALVEKVFKTLYKLSPIIISFGTDKGDKEYIFEQRFNVEPNKST
ncbi:MAG TPA: hypothetical protein VFV86_12330 [Nitrososphaeraceae archaeon]|nr:hypothetical protein [Nitrososphaeraceae archaeon]